MLRGGSGGGTRRRRVPAAARGENSPEFAHLAPQGSVWHAVWPGRVYAGRVIHWWAQERAASAGEDGRRWGRLGVAEHSPATAS